ncbi:MAG: glycosyltransferase [Hydrogenophaga sp.]|uniref:glycosyltransferase n=1 Tax=Hydrogenophaga sp. TaxID=1904254 RepID=UPI0025807383|nr:glycosyltransferase [Hydrogenophaga sp.]MBL0945770.1 glycosyltransferase [Hydrogenophaga sp.]
MKILIVTDAWTPHTHGLVMALTELVRQLQADGHEPQVLHPGLFRHRAGPGWLGMDLALLPGRALLRLMREAAPDAIHIATEGPLGWAARRICLAQGWGFTSAWWLRLPQRLRRGLRLPVPWTAALLRHFHRPAQRVLAGSQAQADALQAAGLAQARAWVAGVDTRLFAPARGTSSRQPHGPLGPLAHPVSLYVGAVALDQRVEDFLRLDVPGSKLVCGAGPDQPALRQRYPNVHWLGFLPRAALAAVYASADVLVHPGRGEEPPATVLEALACGTPVAAYPAEVLLQLIGQTRAAALHDDLREAWHEALRIGRHEARAGALRFAWPRAAERFVHELHRLDRRTDATAAATPFKIMQA